MTDLDGRVGMLEREAATVAERVRQLQDQAREAALLPQTVALLAQKVDDLADDLGKVGESLTNVNTTLKQRDSQASQERNSLKLALIALTGVIVAPIIGGVVTLLVS